MNIRIATSLIIAVTGGVIFNSAARADEQDVRTTPSMRFDFGPNTYELDHTSHRHHYIGTSATPPPSVHSGAAPKNLLGLDPGFVSKPAPLPVVRPVPQTTVAAKPILPTPFASIFGRPPVSPLVAQGAGALPPASFGSTGHLPVAHSSKSTHAKVVSRPHHAPPVGLAAQPSIATYGKDQGYQAGSVLPGYSNTGGMGADASVSGRIIGRKKH
jgi:hypothetical protein